MGLDLPIQWLSLLMFGGLGVLLLLGLPMAFCTGSLAVLFLYLFGNSAMLNMLPSRVFPFMTDYQLSAVPLFIFAGPLLGPLLATSSSPRHSSLVSRKSVVAGWPWEVKRTLPQAPALVPPPPTRAWRQRRKATSRTVVC